MLNCNMTCFCSLTVIIATSQQTEDDPRAILLFSITIRDVAAQPTTSGACFRASAPRSILKTSRLTKKPPAQTPTALVPVIRSREDRANILRRNV